MAYIDIADITNAMARKVIEKDPDLAGRALAEAEDETRAACRFAQVRSEEIPLSDGTVRPAGNLVSDILYVYCKYMFYFFLFEAVKGTVELEDSYSQKAADYWELAQKKSRQITRATILSEDNEVTDRKSRVKAIPVL